MGHNMAKENVMHPKIKRQGNKSKLTSLNTPHVLYKNYYPELEENIGIGAPSPLKQ